MSSPFVIRTPELKSRYAAELRFQWMGRIAIIIAIGFLVLMVSIIGMMGAGALKQTHIALEIELLHSDIDQAAPEKADYDAILKSSLRNMFPDVDERRDKRELYRFVSAQAPFTLKDFVVQNPEEIGQTHILWFIASDDVDMFFKGNIGIDEQGNAGRLNTKEVSWVHAFERTRGIETRFNSRFFIAGDSREPELAGIMSSLMGTALTLMITFAISFPVGIFGAIYLEEFIPKSRLGDVIEVNITNLAAVPSIVFGLLGLTIFLNTFGMPRSSPLVGGLVLALMTLPTIIIASRAALRSVSPSIREAALAVGATKIQTVFHHVVPLALPGMLTGTIVGMARALGETAPLLMIGMVAFIVDVPNSVLAPATALPVQIFLWADSPERAFLEKTSAAIIVLLVFLVLMNLIAIILRAKYRQRY